VVRFGASHCSCQKLSSSDVLSVSGCIPPRSCTIASVAISTPWPMIQIVLVVLQALASGMILLHLGPVMTGCLWLCGRGDAAVRCFVNCAAARGSDGGCGACTYAHYW
jgi:hypothetical protein